MSERFEILRDELRGVWGLDLEQRDDGYHILDESDVYATSEIYTSLDDVEAYLDNLYGCEEVDEESWEDDGDVDDYMSDLDDEDDYDWMEEDLVDNYIDDEDEEW